MCRIFSFFILSFEKNSGTNHFYFIDWNATIPRGRYKCSYIYNTCITNEITGVNNADIQPALVHINLDCQSNFIYTDHRFSNTDVVGFLT